MTCVTTDEVFLFAKIDLMSLSQPPGRIKSVPQAQRDNFMQIHKIKSLWAPRRNEPNGNILFAKVFTVFTEKNCLS